MGCDDKVATLLSDPLMSPLSKDQDVIVIFDYPAYFQRISLVRILRHGG